MKRTSIISLIMLLALFIGCGAKTEQTASADTSALPAGNPDLSSSPAPASAGGSSLTGKLAETMDAGGYTYMRLETESGDTWVAVPQTPVEVGQNVTVSAQMEMKDFESSSLGRTFESITFATMGGPTAASSPGAPGSPHAGVPGMGSMGSAALDDEPIDVARVEGPDGKTVAEIWAERKALDQKIISVRGKVVKFLPQIMGTNWVHLRDGSGDAADGSHDITITTGDVVAAGDIVTAKGQVRIDHDLGGGYNYPVMIENATMTK